MEETIFLLGYLVYREEAGAWSIEALLNDTSHIFIKKQICIFCLDYRELGCFYRIPEIK